MLLIGLCSLLSLFFKTILRVAVVVIWILHIFYAGIWKFLNSWTNIENSLKVMKLQCVWLFFTECRWHRRAWSSEDIYKAWLVEIVIHHKDHSIYIQIYNVTGYTFKGSNSLYFVPHLKGAIYEKRYLHPWEKILSIKVGPTLEG